MEQYTGKYKLSAKLLAQQDLVD